LTPITDTGPPVTVVFPVSESVYAAQSLGFILALEDSPAVFDIPFTAAGTARPGIDYSDLTASPLHFAGGLGEIKFMPILHPGGPNKTLIITLGAPPAGVILSGHVCTVTITQLPTDQQPTAASDVAAVSANEGDTVTNTGTFHDPAGNSNATVTASIGTVTQNNALGTWSWSLNLTDDPLVPTEVTITATDSRNISGDTTFLYSAKLVPPAIALSGNATANDGSPFTLNLGQITDPGQDPITSYTITWGDGTSDTFTGSPANTAATHTYHDGPVAVTPYVTVTDDDGSFVAGSLDVNVLAPTAPLLSSAAATTELVAAIQNANAAGGATTITLAPGATFDFTAASDSTNGSNALPVITANITIVGNFDTIERNMVSGTPAFRLFDVAAGGALTLKSVTLTGGLARGLGIAAQGGAIYNSGTLTLSGVTVKTNRAQGGSNAGPGHIGLNAYGGGLYVAGGTVALVDTAFRVNNAAGGNGGIGTGFTQVGAAGTGGNGGAGYGGGLYVAQGAVTLSNSYISFNNAWGGIGGNGGQGVNTGGGGVGGWGGDGFGGGLCLAGGALTLSNTTELFGAFTNNFAFGGNAGKGGDGGGGSGDGGFGGLGGKGGAGLGGGLYVAEGAATVSNGVFNINWAQGGNGGAGGLGNNGGGGGGDPGDASGGGLYVAGGNVTLLNASFGSNHAQGGAGGDGGDGLPGGNGAGSIPIGFRGGNGGDGRGGGAGLGGGMYLAQGAVTLSDGFLLGNTAQGGNGGTGGAAGAGGNGGFGNHGFAGGAGGTGGNTNPGGAGSGGGMYLAGGTVTLSNTFFDVNRAQGGNGGNAGNGGRGGDGAGGGGSAFGGGGGNGGRGNLGGIAGDGTGGGLYVTGANVMVSNSAFDANIAQGGAGGAGGAAGQGGNGGGGLEGGAGGGGGSGGSAGDGGKSFGGGLYVTGATVILSNDTFSGVNNAQGGAGGAGGQGGGGGAGGGGSIGVAGANGGGGAGGAGGPGSGGGMYLVSGNVTMSNDTLSRNTASGGNGGRGGNNAPGGAGGDANGGGLSVGSYSILANTLIAENTVAAGTGGAGGPGNPPGATGSAGSPSAPDVSGTVTSSDHDLIGDGTGFGAGTSRGDQVGTSSSPINPLLDFLSSTNGGATPTQALLAGSPAIDAGDSNAVPAATDARGFARIVGTAADIGAYEFGATAATTDVSLSGAASSVAPGQFAYSLTLTNNASVVSSNITLTDLLPANTTLVSWTVPSGWSGSAPPVGSSSGTVSAWIAALPANASANFVLVVQINSSLAPGAVINNTASIGPTTGDPNTSDKSVNFQTPVQAISTTTAVTTSATLSTYGDSVTFTATVTGASTTTGNVNFAIDGGTPVAGSAGSTTGTTAAWTYTTSTLAAGTHTVQAFFVGTGSITNSNGTLSGGQMVNKANATVVVTPYSGTYDGQAHTATYTITGVNGETADTVGTITLNTTHTNAGTYASDSWSFTGAADYNNIASTAITDTISPETLTISAVTDSKTYDGCTTSSQTPTVIGTIYNNEVTFAQAFQSKDALGSGGSNLFANYAISAGATGDYTIATNTATGTINPYAFTYQITNDSQTYGSPAKLATDLAATIATGVNGENLSITYSSSGDTATAQVVGSPYAITGSLSDGTGKVSDYSVTLKNGSLTVNPGPLTIAANSDFKNYGTLKTFNVTAFTETGLVAANGDTITGVTETSTGAPAAAAVGTYAIVPSAATGSGLSNYTITYVSGTLTVFPAITVPSSVQTAYENVNQTLNGISIDTGLSSSLTLTLGVGHGTLTLGTTSGLMVTGNGSGSVSLTGSTPNLNAALATLVYRGSLGFSGADALGLTVSVGGISANASAAIAVESFAQEATNLQAQVKVLQTSKVLTAQQAGILLADLSLQSNNGDVGKIGSFINDANGYRKSHVLTQAQANALLGPANILLLGLEVEYGG
jgi:hypothetical protein